MTTYARRCAKILSATPPTNPEQRIPRTVRRATPGTQEGEKPGASHGTAPAQSLGSTSRGACLQRRAPYQAATGSAPAASPSPAPPLSPPDLASDWGLALPSPPTRAPTPSCARAQGRTAERGREGRAGVRPCVRLRQRARRRERARENGGSGRGGSASRGYVAGLAGSRSSFAAPAAS